MTVPVSLFRPKYYFWTGVGALCLLTFAMLTGFRPAMALPGSVRFPLSLATGTALAACILYQWALLFARLTGHGRSAGWHYRNHRYVGTAAIYLFIVHAGGFGYALLTVLPLLFLIVAITGLFNSETIVLPHPWMRRCWCYLHVSLSGLLLPLIVLHTWAALAFK